MSAKRLDLLKQVVAGLTRVAVLYNSRNPVSEPELRKTEAGARMLGLQLQMHGVAEPTDLDRAFSAMRAERADALIVLSDAMLFGRRAQIANLAAANRLPSISWTGEFAAVGGLMSYGPDILAISRRAATYVAKILQGTNPGDLPIEQPTKYDLIVNLRTAKAIGAVIPGALLTCADEVIE